MSLITDKGDDLPILRAEHHGGAGGGGGRGLGGGQPRGGHCRDVYLNNQHTRYLTAGS